MRRLHPVHSTYGNDSSKKFGNVIKLSIRQGFAALLSVLLISSCAKKAVVTGELKKWHCVTLTFAGPAADETGAVNPFLDYRLDVTFTHSTGSYRVPGFFAADGNAAETGASSGNRWRARFTPDQPGLWEYSVSFRKGKNAAVSDSLDAGRPAELDGMSGSFTIGETDKKAPDFRASGMLRYAWKRYLRFGEKQDCFIKSGADSPENFLAYADFDGTPPSHYYRPHLADWREGDPTWLGGKGKGIIGGLNYLASRGVNSIYFITMNVMGDGNDVWPWTAAEERTRFDVSKLDQWEIVFDHMERLGIMMHVLTQETENQLLLDAGYTGIHRRLYYRELISRFGHHLALTWNLGEENGPADFVPLGQTDAMRMDMAAAFKKMDPYRHFTVIHTHADPPTRDRIIRPLLGCPDLDGLSLQIAEPKDVHDETLKWIRASAESHGHPWVVTLDEIGPYTAGVLPDDEDPDHDIIRKRVLWPCLMAGGAGAEWYFGGNHPNNDLNCEDFRSRENMWDMTKVAADFFRQYLPLPDMISRDDLLSGAAGYCLARTGEAYAVYLPGGGDAKLDLGSGKDGLGKDHSKEPYSVFWLNPRDGGGLQKGTVASIAGKGRQSLGIPPGRSGGDWAAVIRRYPKQ
jgi:hypothetical protein